VAEAGRRLRARLNGAHAFIGKRGQDTTRRGAVCYDFGAEVLYRRLGGGDLRASAGDGGDSDIDLLERSLVSPPVSFLSIILSLLLVLFIS